MGSTPALRSSTSFAGFITRALNAHGIYGLTAAHSKFAEGLRIRAQEKLYCGLPTARVKLDYTKDIAHKRIDRDTLVDLLTDAGFHIVDVEADNFAWIDVARCAVRVVAVPSSEAGKAPYSVRVEGHKAVSCGCKGYAYRLNCRHLVEAEMTLFADAS